MITDVVAETQADVVHVVVRSTTPLQYTAFKLQDPPRLVVDMTGAKLGEITQPIPVTGDLVRDVELRVFPDEQTVRLVLYLVRMVAHTVEAQGQQLLVTLQAAPAAATTVSARDALPLHRAQVHACSVARRHCWRSVGGGRHDRDRSDVYVIH